MRGVFDMPVYTYRREDGTTFDVRQSFLDEPLAVDPSTGQKVVRVVHAAGIIFKGSGFYVNDSKSASRSSVNNTANGSGHKDKPEAKTETKAETKTKTETKAEKPATQAAAD